METRTQELRSSSTQSFFVVREGRYLLNEKFKKFSLIIYLIWRLLLLLSLLSPYI